MIKPDIMVSQTVNAPLETLWESWADFGGIYQFHEDVVRTTILTQTTPRGVGAVRRCELVDGKNMIEERVVEWEPMQKISVEFDKTSLPIERARAEFRFKSCTETQSQVEMRFAFTPRGLMLRLMKPVMKRKMRTGFAQLLFSNKLYVEGH
ncbi:SRPBCC family protein [uncultured Litoreibacter sp.]|uniref:SRPBCC family protein n=1 Tax=uncultured Litoreibacter sp. TaxID=1392394 RepID=UPI002605F1CF|nr:SRPBCC family protein [uncultured Litoreibacter sp.]